jgi:hypothetical protein
MDLTYELPDNNNPTNITYINLIYPEGEEI